MEDQQPILPPAKEIRQAVINKVKNVLIEEIKEAAEEGAVKLTFTDVCISYDELIEWLQNSGYTVENNREQKTCTVSW